MKVSISNNNNNKKRFSPPIPLERAEREPLEKGEYLSYKLRNIPGDDTSPVYELSVPFFDVGSCEEWLKFRDNLDKVLIGQNATTGPSKFVITRRLLKGQKSKLKRLKISNALFRIR